MIIACLGDLHGRILLAFKLVQRWQAENGIPVDLILCTGDVGVFPDTRKMDRASARHLERDRSEAGFAEYFFTSHPEAESVTSPH